MHQNAPNQKAKLDPKFLRSAALAAIGGTLLGVLVPPGCGLSRPEDEAEATKMPPVPALVKKGDEPAQHTQEKAAPPETAQKPERAQTEVAAKPSREPQPAVSEPQRAGSPEVAVGITALPPKGKADQDTARPKAEQPTAQAASKPTPAVIPLPSVPAPAAAIKAPERPKEPVVAAPAPERATAQDLEKLSKSFQAIRGFLDFCGEPSQPAYVSSEQGRIVSIVQVREAVSRLEPSSGTKRAIIAACNALLIKPSSPKEIAQFESAVKLALDDAPGFVPGVSSAATSAVTSKGRDLRDKVQSVNQLFQEQFRSLAEFLKAAKMQVPELRAASSREMQATVGRFMAAVQAVPGDKKPVAIAEEALRSLKDHGVNRDTISRFAKTMSLVRPDLEALASAGFLSEQDRMRLGVALGRIGDFLETHGEPTPGRGLEPKKQLAAYKVALENLPPSRERRLFSDFIAEISRGDLAPERIKTFADSVQEAARSSEVMKLQYFYSFGHRLNAEELQAKFGLEMRSLRDLLEAGGWKGAVPALETQGAKQMQGTLRSFISAYEKAVKEGGTERYSETLRYLTVLESQGITQKSLEKFVSGMQVTAIIAASREKRAVRLVSPERGRLIIESEAWASSVERALQQKKDPFWSHRPFGAMNKQQANEELRIIGAFLMTAKHPEAAKMRNEVEALRARWQMLPDA